VGNYRANESYGRAAQGSRNRVPVGGCPSLNDTTNILFVCSGATVQAPEDRKPGEIFREVEPEDLLKYGLIPEFVGRRHGAEGFGSIERSIVIGSQQSFRHHFPLRLLSIPVVTSYLGHWSGAPSVLRRASSSLTICVSSSSPKPMEVARPCRAQ
jgi:hypothetical protein